MTKEELKQKASEWVKEHTLDGISKDIPHIVLPPRTIQVDTEQFLREVDK